MEKNAAKYEECSSKDGNAYASGVLNSLISGESERSTISDLVKQQNLKLGYILLKYSYMVIESLKFA